MTLDEALDIERMPKAFQEYFKEELAWMGNQYGGGTVLDVGCGTGRFMDSARKPITTILGETYELFDRYIGVDNHFEMIKKARQRAQQYSHVALYFLDAHDLPKYFSKQDDIATSVCLFNTLGCADNPLELLKSISAVTQQHVLITVAAKGALDLRIAYYETLGIPYHVDMDTQSIHSPIWGESKAFLRKDLEEMGEQAGLIFDPCQHTVLADIYHFAAYEVPK